MKRIEIKKFNKNRNLFILRNEQNTEEPTFLLTNEISKGNYGTRLKEGFSLLEE